MAGAWRIGWAVRLVDCLIARYCGLYDDDNDDGIMMFEAEKI